MSSPTESAGDAGPELSAVLGRLHRALRRHVRETFAGPALPQSQVEILRLLYREPGMRAREVAERLGLASNTVSTLLQQLSRRGYVDRQVDSSDRRSARLALTDAAVARMNSWSDKRAATLGMAMRSLEVADLEQIVSAQPALERLATVLECTRHEF